MTGSRPLLLLLGSLLTACGGATASISGEFAGDGSCSATIDGESLVGPPGGVRIISRAAAVAEGEEPRYVLVVYCRLGAAEDEEEEPARIDFVKRNAPAGGELEPGTYTIDREGDGPRSIGVVVTAPAHLRGTRDWQPTSGTLEVRSSTRRDLEATFEMELRDR